MGEGGCLKMVLQSWSLDLALKFTTFLLRNIVDNMSCQKHYLMFTGKLDLKEVQLKSGMII